MAAIRPPFVTSRSPARVPTRSGEPPLPTVGNYGSLSCAVSAAVAAQPRPDRRRPQRPEDERERKQSEERVHERHPDLQPDREGEGGGGRGDLRERDDGEQLLRAG